MSLLFYDEVMRGVESRVRERQLVPADHLPARGREAGRAARRTSRCCRGCSTLSGKVDGLLIGEGVVPPPVVAGLATRLPVVVVAGDTTSAAPTSWRRTTGRARTPLVTHLVAEHGRRRLFHVDGPASAPDAQVRRLAMQAVVDAHPARC